MQKTYTADLKKQTHASKVLIAVSGGRDSAVAAELLKTQGFELIGVHFQMLESSRAPFTSFCSRCASHSEEAARKVCLKLDLSFRIHDARGAYHAEVIDHLVHESLQFRAPRACFRCNQEIIFKGLMELADQLGCTRIATGHYAQLIQDSITGQAILSKAADSRQDQSHLLYGLSQETLKRCIFPLGTLSHSMVEKLAREMEVDLPPPTGSATPGGDLCFTSKKTFSTYLEDHTAVAFRPSGVIRTQNGEIVGEHSGLHQFTLGQAVGSHSELKLTLKDADRYCVSGFDGVNHALIVSERFLLHHEVLIASEAHWLRSVSQIRPFRSQIRVVGNFSGEDRSSETTCRVTIFENSTLRIELDESLGILSPGQAVVFYDASEVLGGAVIERLLAAEASADPVPR